jgi:L-amino acid N-acyltransferase YncA
MTDSAVPRADARTLPSIRLAEEKDAPAIAEIYRPSVEAAVISFETDAPDAQEMRNRLAHTMPRHPWLVCEVGSSRELAASQVAGYAYASRHHERAAYRWSVNVSVYIDERCRRAGVGRALYTSLFAILAAQGYINAYAGITLPNPASVGLHEALGFQPLAVYRKVGYKRGAWHDVGWWQRPLATRPGIPNDPIDIPTLMRRADWRSLLESGLSCIRADAAC